MDIVLASEERDLRLALELLLREEPWAYVVGTASHAGALLALVRTACPNLVLLDWDLPGQSPSDLIAEVASADPHPRIIVLSKDADASQVALAAGADESVVKGDRPALLLDALRRVGSQS